jgi:hypothetical protein
MRLPGHSWNPDLGVLLAKSEFIQIDTLLNQRGLFKRLRIPWDGTLCSDMDDTSPEHLPAGGYWHTSWSM